MIVRRFFTYLGQRIHFNTLKDTTDHEACNVPQGLSFPQKGAPGSLGLTVEQHRSQESMLSLQKLLLSYQPTSYIINGLT